jgi:hypothetical protein
MSDTPETDSLARGSHVVPISSFLLEGWKDKDPTLRVMKWLVGICIAGHTLMIGGYLIMMFAKS